MADEETAWPTPGCKASAHDAHNAANQTEKEMRDANPNDVRTSEKQGSPGVNPVIE